jgi:hypothetical protein
MTTKMELGLGRHKVPQLQQQPPSLSLLLFYSPFYRWMRSMRRRRKTMRRKITDLYPNPYSYI